MTVARLRPSAEGDLVERTRHYQSVGGDDLGGRFFDSAIASLHAIEQMPSAGSPLIGELADIPGLRVRRIPGLPCSWFYFVGANHVDIVRLLADAQDLPSIDLEIEPE